jgi:hypothetical protein
MITIASFRKVGFKEGIKFFSNRKKDPVERESELLFDDQFSGSGSVTFGYFDDVNPW